MIWIKSLLPKEKKQEFDMHKQLEQLENCLADAESNSPNT